MVSRGKKQMGSPPPLDLVVSDSPSCPRGQQQFITDCVLQTQVQIQLVTNRASVGKSCNLQAGVSVSCVGTGRTVPPAGSSTDP